MPSQNQAELVMEDQGFKSKEVTRRITMPGLEQLHNKPTKEIAEVLSIAMRSEPNVVEIRYRLGEYIELTSTQD